MTEFNKPWTHVNKDRNRTPVHVPLVERTQFVKYCMKCKRAVASDMGNLLRPYTMKGDGRYICNDCAEGRGRHEEK